MKVVGKFLIQNANRSQNLMKLSFMIEGSCSLVILWSWIVFNLISDRHSMNIPKGISLWNILSFITEEKLFSISLNFLNALENMYCVICSCMIIKGTPTFILSRQINIIYTGKVHIF